MCQENLNYTEKGGGLPRGGTSARQAEWNFTGAIFLFNFHFQSQENYYLILFFSQGAVFAANCASKILTLFFSSINIMNTYEDSFPQLLLKYIGSPNRSCLSSQ